MRKKIGLWFTVLAMVLNCTAVVLAAENKTLDIGYVNSVANTITGSRAASLCTYEIGGKDYLYIGIGDNAADKGGVMVCDITNPEDIENVQQISAGDINIGVYNHQLAVSDGYLFVANGRSNFAVEAYKLKNDGTVDISSKKTIIATAYGNRVRQIQIVDDYLFVGTHGAGDGTNDGIIVMDISDVDDGAVQLAEKNKFGAHSLEVDRVGDMYRMYCIQRTKQGNDSIYKVSIMDYNPQTKSIIEQSALLVDDYGLGSGSVSDIFVIDDEHIGAVDTTVGSTTPMVIFNTKNPSAPYAEISTAAGRGQSGISLGDGYIIFGGVQNGAVLYKLDFDEDTATKVKGFTEGIGGQNYRMLEYKGNLYIAANGTIGVYKLWTSAELEDIEIVNDGILNIKAQVSCGAEDSVVLYINGEETDVTDRLSGGKLDYTTDITLADGEYDAVIAVVRNGEAVVEDSKKFTVKKTKQLVIDVDNLNVAELTGKVINSHKRGSEAATLYAVVYNADGSMVKSYPNSITELGVNGEQSFEITLDAAISNGQIIKLFTVTQSGKVISETVENGVQSFNTDSTNIPAVVAEKVNMFAEITPSSVVKISGKSCIESVQDIFVTVYKPDGAVDYINTFKSNEDGSFYLDYQLVGGVEGQNYTINAYASADSVVSGERFVSYYTQETIDIALAAMLTATGETFDTVIKNESYVSGDETYNLKNIYNLDTSVYDGLEPEYKKAVAGEIAGKTYLTIAALNSAFDAKVSEQKILMDKANAIKDAIKAINSVSADTMEKALGDATDVLGLTFNKLYTDWLDTDMKTNLYTNWLYNKGFTTAEQINTAIKEGTAVEYIKLAQYSEVVDEEIIETYWEELGLDSSYVNKYEDYGYNARVSIIKDFLGSCENITAYTSVSSEFTDAVSDYKKPSSGGGSSGSSSGGVVIPPSSAVTAPGELSNADMISDDVLKLEKTNPFGDVSFDDWYFEAVCELNEKKIVEGITDTEFKPNDNVKREELVKMIMSAYNRVDYNAQAPFADTAKGRWYYSYIASAYKLGVVNGISENKFGVGLEITREDLAKIVYGAMTAMGETFEEGNADFADMSSVSDYAADSVKALSKAGIFTGYEDNTFRPKAKVTRAMAAQVIYRVLNY